MEEKDKKTDSALNVQKGISQPSQVNPDLAGGIKKFRKEKLTIDDFRKGILKGDRSLLSRAITVIESTLPKDQEFSRQLINTCLPYSGNSIRLGITGTPGAGKSTFIESFGLYLISQGHKVAVLAIDPSSKRTKGSILGDKTRMESLSTNTSAFIRPSASSGTLGGIARATREAIILCETAGFDITIVETVGVGQSETAVSQIVDFFVLLQLAGGGDELQGIKRGIMEMADLIVINKADGDNIRKAELAKREYENALHLFPMPESGWTPKVLTASAIKEVGLEAIWDSIKTYTKLAKKNGYFKSNRQQQSFFILHNSINQSLSGSFFAHDSIKSKMKEYEHQILSENLSPYEAARLLLETYFKTISK